MLSLEQSDKDTLVSNKTAAVDLAASESDAVAYEKAVLQAEDTPVSSDEVDPPPDGGMQAWLVALGSFLNLFSTFGVVNSYVSQSVAVYYDLTNVTHFSQGVFQEHYTTTLLPHSSSSVISLIGSLQLALLYGMSPLVGRIYDAYGSPVRAQFVAARLSG